LHIIDGAEPAIAEKKPEPIETEKMMSMEDAMDKKVGILFFSATNATKKVCEAIALGMGAEKPTVFDITLPAAREEIIAHADTLLDEVDHLIVGAPVHVGKIPRQAEECLRAIKGSGKKCTPVVVYGNRDFGAALYQMVDILIRNGFVVVGAGMFIGQHSYSDLVPAGMNRPDESDIAKAMEFGAKASNGGRPLKLSDVPVQWDMYSRSRRYSVLKASYEEGTCVKCGRCSKACPLGLISSETGGYLSSAARKRCIGCMACVRACRPKARTTKANPLVKFVLKAGLKSACRDRKEPFVIV
jgi:ferredoxin